MQKTISIIRGRKEETFDDFHTRINHVVEKLKVMNPSKLHYTITLEKPPGGSVIPFRKDKIALISVHGVDENSFDFIHKTDGFSGTYKVTEALPIAYEKYWKDGEATPGVCLLTLFRQNKKIDYAVFMDRWYNGHTPLTLKIHPIYHYNRNQVNESIGNPPILYDGIVEEHCRTRAALINPFKFFAKSGFAVVNMIKTYFDVKSFIDYKSIETYFVAEFHIKS